MEHFTDEAEDVPSIRSLGGSDVPVEIQEISPTYPVPEVTFQAPETVAPTIDAFATDLGKVAFEGFSAGLPGASWDAVRPEEKARWHASAKAVADQVRASLTP